MSDLHLEAVRYPEAFQPERPGFDVLIVAGDVWEGSSARALSTIWPRACARRRTATHSLVRWAGERLSCRNTTPPPGGRRRSARHSASPMRSSVISHRLG